LNSVANFNFVLKASDLEVGSADEEMDLVTLVRHFMSKDSDVVASMRAEFGER
jgi:hypothetical protein